MNRRELIKQGTAALLAASTLNTAALPACKKEQCTLPNEKPLVVTFTGPFCFWEEQSQSETTIYAMAAPVGRTFSLPHQPWMGTSTNETQLNVGSTVPNSPIFQLKGLDGAKEMRCQGVEIYTASQGSCSDSVPPQPGACTPPLFMLELPLPDLMIGLNTTCVEINNGQEQLVASRVSFFYQKARLQGIQVQQAGNCAYQPLFQNDACLPMATLGVNLTPTVIPDPGHVHATQVFYQMMTMCPWLKLNTIKFPCTPAGNSCPTVVNVGDGADCKVPQMMLTPTLPGQRRGKATK
jgi:hypothetical protein